MAETAVEESIRAALPQEAVCDTNICNPIQAFLTFHNGCPMEEFVDKNNYHYETELKTCGKTIRIQNIYPLNNRIDGIILCLTTQVQVDLLRSATAGGDRSTDIELILGIKSIDISCPHPYKTFTVSSLQLLDYYLGYSEIQRKNILRIVRDKVIFDIDWKVLFGTTDEKTMLYITQATLYGKFGMRIDVSFADDKIYKNIQGFKFKGVISNSISSIKTEGPSERIVAPFEYGNDNVIDEKDNTEKLDQNGGKLTVWLHNHCIVKKILVLSDYEIHDFILRLDGINTHFFENFMCLKYHDSAKNIYFYTIDLKDGYYASRIDNERLVINFGEITKLALQTRRPKVLITSIITNLVNIAEQSLGVVFCS